MICMSVVCSSSFVIFFFFKQKTAYEMRISDWSSDVCSSDLSPAPWPSPGAVAFSRRGCRLPRPVQPRRKNHPARRRRPTTNHMRKRRDAGICRSEEHTSELQSLMRISYAVFCLKKKKRTNNQQQLTNTKADK